MIGASYNKPNIPSRGIRYLAKSATALRTTRKTYGAQRDWAQNGSRPPHTASLIPTGHIATLPFPFPPHLCAGPWPSLEQRTRLSYRTRSPWPMRKTACTASLAVARRLPGLKLSITCCAQLFRPKVLGKCTPCGVLCAITP
jgi:hypothetical protein